MSLRATSELLLTPEVLILRVDFKEIENFRDSKHMIRRHLEGRPTEQLFFPKIYFSDAVICSAIIGVVYAILF